VAVNQTHGPILTDTAGKTLYYFTNDQANVSNCYDQCATNWPPVVVTGQPIWPTALPGLFGTFARRDGAMQATYNGMPLYTYARDANVGDTTGHEVGDVWFIAEPGQIFVPDGQTAIKVVQDPTHGQILTDAFGFTLYYYTRDELNKSYCYGNCARNWPPLVIAKGTLNVTSGVPGTLGTVERTDGNEMVTYNGMPLYYWISDAKPGDTLGHLVGNVWYVVPPSNQPAENFPKVPATPAPAATKPAATTPAATPATKTSSGY
jgi:predicted lipoprotein with Yx(FWY)xxD motif